MKMDTSSPPTLVRAGLGEILQNRNSPVSASPPPFAFSLGLPIWCVGLLLATLSGCGKPEGNAALEAEPAPQIAPAKQSDATSETFDLTQLPRSAETVSSSETWYINTMQGKQLGYRHTQVRELQIDERRLVLTNILEKQRMRRFGEKFSMEIRANQLEDEQGKILRFSYALPPGLGPGPMQGIVQGDVVNLRSVSSPEAEPKQVPWPAGTVGFDGVEQALIHTPMRPGETRDLQMLQIPPLELVSKVRLRALGLEKTTLPAGEFQLLKIEQQLTMPGGGQMLIYLWTDEQGRVLKYSIPQLQQETFLSTQAQALEESDTMGLDLGKDLLVRLPEPLENPHRAEQQTYQARWKETDSKQKLADLFPASLSQAVSPVDDREIMVTVKAIRPHRPIELPAVQPEPTPADLRRSDLVESDDPEILKLANAATAAVTAEGSEVAEPVGDAEGAEDAEGAKNATLAWHQALALEKFVHNYLTEKNYSQAFSSAAEVARTREGDCTEHAVLLAALCRAKRIPARVAYGLVYVPSQQAFAFHMWNEVWIKDRWIPLDATLALGGIGAGHLKLGTSSLADLTGLLDLLPVMRVMGRLEIRAVQP